jgi:threonyl-tRNA synthetase
MSEKYAEKVEEIAKEIEAHCIRVDIDERPFTLQKRIREAETEWVPYVIVVGQREIESGALSVRDREAHGKVQNMKLSELIAKLQNELKDKPFKPLPLPRNLSKRPQFYG